MTARTEKIDSIIAARKEKGAAIASIQRWMWNAREELSDFRSALAETGPDVSAQALASSAASIEADLGAASSALEKVRSHFAKDTLAVAVVGQAGMGKSTFLQSLTGLGNDQIPASGGRACTSTQSCIANLPSGVPGYADVFYYSRSEMTSILADCYALLGWPAPAFRTMAEFVRDFDAREKPDSSSMDSLWRLLKTYRDNAEALEQSVFSPGVSARRVGLDEVASFVTYADGESRAENLGVARVEIHCAFPSADVGKLVVVDTPGMNAASEERDKAILSRVLDETADFVLFVGIPTERGITRKEREMFDSCRSCARLFSDTPLDLKAFYVANQAVVRDAGTGEIRRNGADAEYNALWQKDFDAGVIPAQRLVKVDAKDPSAVRAAVLDPMVDYLVATLPDLDEKELVAARESIAAFRERIAAFVAEARRTLRLDRAIGQDDYRKLRDLFESSFPRFSGALQRFVDSRATVLDGDSDSSTAPNPFMRKISDVFTSFRDGLEDSLSDERVRFEMDRNPGQGGAAFFNLLSFMRCNVRDRFSAVEDACREMVEASKREISGLFVAPFPHGGGFGNVAALKDSDGNPLAGSEFFRAFAALCRETPDGAQLAAQCEAFADFELRFSGFLEHHVSTSLSPLRQATFADSLSGSVDFSSEASIRAALLTLAEESANRVACELAEKSASAPELAVFAVAEDFIDRTLRTEGVEKSWISLYELLRGEVWPDVFDPNSTANRSATRLRERLDAVSSILRQIPQA